MTYLSRDLTRFRDLDLCPRIAELFAEDLNVL